VFRQSPEDSRRYTNQRSDKSTQIESRTNIRMKRHGSLRSTYKEVRSIAPVGLAPGTAAAAGGAASSPRAGRLRVLRDEVGILLTALFVRSRCNVPFLGIFMNVEWRNCLLVVAVGRFSVGESFVLWKRWFHEKQKQSRERQSRQEQGRQA
jgi:hypothetical protein